MSILITGGAGYIGSHTCVELLEAGYEVIVIDDFSNSHPAYLQRVQQLTGKSIQVYSFDLLDAAKLENVFATHKIQAVIHFAGFKAVGESVEQPLKYYTNNLVGTITLCRLMEKYHVHRMVFSSSATVYGLPKQLPIKEDFSVSATNPYGQTKLICEQILTDLGNANPLWSIALLRYFNPVGAHPSGQLGEAPNGIPNNLMPYITSVAAGQREYLRIFGNDYDTPDGTGVRDYIHVVDLAKGHLSALHKIFKSRGVEAYNLGTGQGYSVIQMVEAVKRASGRAIPYIFTERRPGDIAACYADPSKARRELDWTAEKGLAEMCEDAWRWQVQLTERAKQEEERLAQPLSPVQEESISYG